jgi:hypothetical protein
VAYRIDSPVLVISALAAFFATFFATLLLIQKREPEPEPQSLADPPPVDAGPSGQPSPPAAESQTDARRQLQRQLEELGVRCAEGADCLSD